MSGPTPETSRDDELRTPHGWLSLVAYHWLPSEPDELPGLPGLWWADTDGAHHRADDDRTGVRAPGGAPFETVVVAEGGSHVAGTFLPEDRAQDPGSGDAHESTPDVAVEVVRRTGRYAVRVRDPLAPTRTTFDGVRRFDHDASWVLDLPVRWFDEPRDVVVGAARPGLVHTLRTVGEVDVERDGRSATLSLTDGPGGALTLLFSDEADDVAPWRVLRIDAPDENRAGRVVLDLNRSVNLPFAFTDFGTCPAPVPGNHVPAAVAAGERAPR